MVIYVNDKPIKFSDERVLVSDVINNLKLKNKKIIILKYGIILKSEEFLYNNDRIDIISFIGGG